MNTSVRVQRGRTLVCADSLQSPPAVVVGQCVPGTYYCGSFVSGTSAARGSGQGRTCGPSEDDPCRADPPSDLMSCGRERETAPRSSHHVARGWQQEKRSRIMHSTWSHVEHAEPAQKCAYTRQNAHHSTHGGRRCSVQVASHGRGQRGSLGPAHVDGAFVKVGEVRARLAAFVAALRSAQPPPLPA